MPDPDPRPGQATPSAAAPPHAREQEKAGRFWFYAAAVVGGAVLIATVLLWGANGPLLPGAGAPHRASGLAMLRCAADQGDVEAYRPLGETARREGRWVDAYRIFEMGANQGCMPCMEELEAPALLNPGSSGGRYDTEGEVPAINQLRSFYGQQFLWRLTGLMELRRPAPQAIQLQLSDEQVRGLIELEMKKSRQRPAPR